MGQRKWHSPTHMATRMEKVYKREATTNSMYMTGKELVCLCFGQCSNMEML